MAKEKSTRGNINQFIVAGELCRRWYSAGGAVRDGVGVVHVDAVRAGSGIQRRVVNGYQR